MARAKATVAPPTAAVHTVFLSVHHPDPAKRPHVPGQRPSRLPPPTRPGQHPGAYGVVIVHERAHTYSQFVLETTRRGLEVRALLSALEHTPLHAPVTLYLPVDLGTPLREAGQTWIKYEWIDPYSGQPVLERALWEEIFARAAERTLAVCRLEEIPPALKECRSRAHALAELSYGAGYYRAAWGEAAPPGVPALPPPPPPQPTEEALDNTLDLDAEFLASLAALDGEEPPQ